ncbi:hypothetical protein MTR67_037873 [Solanum verrucosum]|uniref:Uncharacterized protein n=1 Tax=Solanum verrucosum TaxID=315347 RepID=A0AAF0UER2_SOLVR|nr:hypothetical protein MTR67_037873 [Solanum verrucosum]
MRNDLCGKSHFHICLIQRITEFAPQIFCFGPESNQIVFNDHRLNDFFGHSKLGFLLSVAVDTVVAGGPPTVQLFPSEFSSYLGYIHLAVAIFLH